MFHRLLRLLCLLAALTGHPLRQAEAADDLARSMAEDGYAHVLEEADGGVGDDSGVSLCKAGAMQPVESATPVPFEWPEARQFATAHVGLIRRHDRPATTPGGTVARHAWLQRFLC